MSCGNFSSKNNAISLSVHSVQYRSIFFSLGRYKYEPTNLMAVLQKLFRMTRKETYQHLVLSNNRKKILFRQKEEKIKIKSVFVFGGGNHVRNAIGNGFANNWEQFCSHNLWNEANNNKACKHTPPHKTETYRIDHNSHFAVNKKSVKPAKKKRTKTC